MKITTNEPNQIARLQARLHADMKIEAKVKLKKREAENAERARIAAEIAFEKSPEGQLEKAKRIQALREYLLQLSRTDMGSLNDRKMCVIEVLGELADLEGK